jgi:Flp pilus assembly protein TadG
MPEIRTAQVSALDIRWQETTMDEFSLVAKEVTAMGIPKFLRFWSDRSASTAIVLGLSAPAMIAISGLAIDFAGVLAARTKIELGADSGALVSVMTASNALMTDPANYIADGVAAGQARFRGQIGTISTVNTPSATITVTRSGNVITGSATWTATYNTFFGTLFGVPSWPLNGVASVSTQVTAPFLNITVMLDNSPSMEIGATDADIAVLQNLTACSLSGAYLPDSEGNWSSPTSGQTYAAYQCTSGSSYNGSLSCPIPTSPPWTVSALYPTSNWNTAGPSCKGWLAPVHQSSHSQAQGNPSQLYAKAGAPCAFACHFDTNKPAGAGDDYYGVARGTIGTNNPVTLRFDVVKAAVNTLISTMQTNDLPIKNLKAGIFTFDDNLTRVYPGTGEAGDDWPAINAAIGGPPTVANGPDTGIQPYGGNNGGDTDFPTTMATLAGQLTPSGDGTTATAPRKVLFLVTDGVQDFNDANGNRQLGAIDPAYCQTFKNMGYAIYVVYTPYYPLMNGYYLSNMTNIVEGSGVGTTATNLRACASSPANYIAATDSASLTTALQTFFRLATTPPAHFSK